MGRWRGCELHSGPADDFHPPQGRPTNPVPPWHNHFPQCLVDDLRSDFDDKCGGVPRMIQSLGNLNAVGSTLEQALMSLGDIDIDVSAIQPDVASWQHSIKLGTIDLPCYEGMDTWGFDFPVPEPIGDVGISVDY